MFCDQYYNSQDLYLNIMLLLLKESLATSFFNQSKIKPKPIMTSSHAFSYSWHWLPVIAPSSKWLIVLTVSAVIGQVIINIFLVLVLCFGFIETRSMTRLHACTITTIIV